jgi:serine/threonine-protein kinase
MLSEAWQLLLPFGMLIGLLIAKRAQGYGKSVFLRYAGEKAACCLPGQDVARRFLAVLGLERVTVVRCRGFSRYRPWRRQVCLNGVAFDETGLPAVVIAAHEVGHAQQFALGYLPARLYLLLAPLLYLFALAALMASIGGLAGWMPIGIAQFALPLTFAMGILLMMDLLLLECDATRRAKTIARQTGMVAPGEQPGFDLMLRGALITHVGRTGYLASVAIVAGAMYAVGAMDGQVALPTAENVRHVAASRGSPRTVPPDLSQEVLNVELDLVTPLVRAGIIAAALMLWPIYRGIKKARAITHCSAARVLQNRGELKEAIARYDKALHFNRKHIAAFVGRSSARLLLGRLDEALADVEAAMGLAPGVAGLLTLRGIIQLRRQDYEHALADLNEALRLVPSSNQALVARARLRQVLQDFAWAEADLERAITGNPNDVDALQARCRLRLARHDQEGAIADINWVFELGAHDADSFALRGAVRAERQQFELALADYDEAVQLAPQRGDVFSDRGFVRLSAGDFAGAIADATRALQIDPNNAVAFNNRGVAYLKSGRYAQAAVDLRAAIHLEPSFPNPYKHLAWLQATCPLPDLRNGDEAVSNATRALELAQWQPVAWLATLAAAYAEAGNFSEARRWQMKCLDESSREATDELQRGLDFYIAEQPFREILAAAIGRSGEAAGLAASLEVGGCDS